MLGLNPLNATFSVVPVLTQPAGLSQVLPAVVSIQYSYEVAPLLVFHDNVGLIETFVLAFAGLNFWKLPGVVANDHQVPLLASVEPKAFTARTCQ